MTLREWLTLQPYGALAATARNTGFHKEHVRLVADGKRSGSAFFASVIRDYTGGLVQIAGSERTSKGSITRHKGGYQVQFGRDYVCRSPTMESAQMALQQYSTKGTK